MTEMDNRFWREFQRAAPDLVAALFPRSPNYRCFRVGQHKFCWTTERMSDGKYHTFDYAPVGPGARTGKAKRWKLRREVKFATRKAARARALARYYAARAKEA